MNILEKEMATHSRIPAWKISWTQEPGGLQSMGSQGVGHDWATNTYVLTITAALGLGCCLQSFSSCSEQGLLSSCGAQVSP